MNISCISAFFGQKLILAVFWQRFKIEACVMRQIFCISVWDFSGFHFYGKSAMLASDWLKPNIGCILATVQHRNTCNTPNRWYFQCASYIVAILIAPGNNI